MFLYIRYFPIGLIPYSYGDLQLYEKNGEVKLFYLNSSNFLSSITYVQGSGVPAFSAPSIFNPNAPMVKSHLTIKNKDEVFYRNFNDNLVYANSSGEVRILASNEVSGRNMVVNGDDIVYASKSGKLAYIRNLSTQRFTVQSSFCGANTGISLTNNNLVYVYANGLVDIVPFSSDGIYEEAEHVGPFANDNRLSNGYLTTNPASGVVYVKQTNDKVFQVYSKQSGGYVWQDMDAEVYNYAGLASGEMLFSSPHLFFVSSSGVIGNTFYYTNDPECRSVLEREGTNIEIQDELSIFPNPANTTCLVQSKDALLGELKIINSQGKIVYSKELDGKKEIPLVLDLPMGMYYVLANGKTQKLVIE